MKKFNSSKYWERRYKKQGNSGCGSYSCLAEFKADIINKFIESQNDIIRKIIDYGVGDGNQLQLINTLDKIYIGIDVSPTVIKKCEELFIDDNTKSFMLADKIDDSIKGDLVISCDVIFHLVEDNVYDDYMRNLFNMSNKYVIIYAKDEDIYHKSHVRFRKFSNYINSNLQEWKLLKHIPNKYPQNIIGNNNTTTSPSDFYIYIKNI